MSIKIEVSKSAAEIHPNPRGPHFWEKHDQNLHETAAGEEYELSLPKVVEYLAKEPEDAELREAMAIIFGNCGISIRWGAFDTGERQVGKLFIQHQPPDGTPNRGARINTSGKPFVALLLEHMAVLLAEGEISRDASRRRIHGHILRFIQEAGLEPNLERLRMECCLTCLGATSQQVQLPEAEDDHA